MLQKRKVIGYQALLGNPDNMYDVRVFLGEERYHQLKTYLQQQPQPQSIGEWIFNLVDERLKTIDERHILQGGQVEEFEGK